MSLYLVGKARNHLGWMVLSGIIGLVLISCLPMVTVYDADLAESVTYNFALMEKSSNAQIRSLREDLYIPIIFLWLILIFSILPFIGMIIHLSEKISIGRWIMLSGCLTTAFSSLFIIFIFNWMGEAENLEKFSLTYIGPVPISYIYFVLAFGIVSLTSSAFYTFNVISFSIRYFREKENKKEKKKGDKESKKQKKEKSKQSQKEKPEPVDKKPTSIGSIQKHDEIEEWLKGEVDQIKKSSISTKTEIEKSEIGVKTEGIIKVEEKVEVEKTNEVDEEPLKIEPVKSEEEPAPTPFGKKQIYNIEEEKLQAKLVPEKKEVDSDEIPTSKTFENALLSAIEKRQPGENKVKQLPLEGKKVKKDEKLKKIIPEEKKEVKKDIINVRCPECKTVFKVQREGETMHIKCPSCGKEGIAK